MPPTTSRTQPTPRFDKKLRALNPPIEDLPRRRSVIDPQAVASRAARINKACQSDCLRQMIAEAAYYKAEQRGFSPGGELSDWVAAEKEIMAMLFQ